MKKYKFCLLLGFLCIFLTGCWDVISIEDRGYVIGIAIDVAEEQDNNITLNVTNQIVIPSGISTISQGGGSGEAFVNISATGHSIDAINKKLSTVSRKAPFYEHLMILIISEEIARTPHLFNKIFDIFVRDVDMRRSVKVLISMDQGNKILDYKSVEEKVPSIHLNSLMELGIQESGYFLVKTVGDIEEYHLEKNSYVLPIIKIDENMQYETGAVFHGTKSQMVGIFSPEELIGLDLIVRNSQGKVIELEYKGDILAFEIDKMSRKTSINTESIDQLKVDYKIEVNGRLEETFTQHDLLDKEVLLSIEKAVSKKIENMMEKAVTKGQQELNVDVYNIWQMLESKHYETWKKVENDWDDGENFFSKVVFNFEVETTIESVGTSIKTD